MDILSRISSEVKRLYLSGVSPDRLILTKEAYNELSRVFPVGDRFWGMDIILGEEIEVRCKNIEGFLHG